jgi:NADH-quinone oxidoreductase subunit H
MAFLQRRFGPNIIGLAGLLQPLADGLKLFIKERVLPYKATLMLFFLAPMLVFIFSMFLWLFLAVSQYLYSDLTLGFLYILVINVLEVYGIMFAGWSSNSKYAFLGGLRSTAQMISYEISLGFIFLSIIFFVGSFNLMDIILYQYMYNLWFCIPLFPLCLIFLISMLAETNRAPFDLPEAEAEIVAGYNVEYSGFFFALFFLGEYSNMLFLSALFVLLFLGGGSFLLLNFLILAWIFSFIYGVKVCFSFLWFIWVRATLPRYRYDQLMDLGWKVFLPFTFSFLTFLVSILYFSKSFPIII